MEKRNCGILGKWREKVRKRLWNKRQQPTNRVIGRAKWEKRKGGTMRFEKAVIQYIARRTIGINTGGRAPFLVVMRQREKKQFGWIHKVYPACSFRDI
jgi:hypothetical protein